MPTYDGKGSVGESVLENLFPESLVCAFVLDPQILDRFPVLSSTHGLPYPGPQGQARDSEHHPEFPILNDY